MPATTAKISFHQDFIRSKLRLSASDSQRVDKAVAQFIDNPDHPGLNLHPVETDPTNRLHTIRASQELRVLLAREGNTFWVLEAGHHDDVYDRANRGRFVINTGTKYIGLVVPSKEEVSEQVPSWSAAAPSSHAADDRPGALDHWSHADLQEAGFADDQVEALRSCRSEDALFDIGLLDDDVLLALELIEQTPEQWRSPVLVESDAKEAEARDVVTTHGALWGFSKLFSSTELARLAAAPIEEWMIFLHPDQQAVVTRRYDGPARVRGAAGTGKTVVALHRAAELAQRFHSEEPEAPIVLFTTYVKSLPPVLENLYLRLPNAIPGAVEFINVDKLAWRICREGGRRVWNDSRGINAAFATAWRKVITPGSPIDRAKLSSEYLRSEVTAVIKGRGIEDVDAYLAIERTGRRTAFPEAMRRQAWDLAELWREEMTARGTVDFSDVLLVARDVALERKDPTYRAAIIDEAQDITMVGVQLVRALVNGGRGADRPDGLLLVGDGAQRIYSSCFTLKQAGVEVAGRSTVLRINYRNTPEIMTAALAVTGSESIEDLEESYRREEELAEPTRAAAARPVVVDCGSDTGELDYVDRTSRELVKDEVASFGDIAVLVATNRAVKRTLRGLAERGIDCLPLDRYNGQTTDQIKIGTYNRAKGLEFKVVFLPGLSEAFPRPRQPGQDETEHEEDRALELSRLFVAMTRARDRLFLLAPGVPSPALQEHLGQFDYLEETVPG